MKKLFLFLVYIFTTINLAKAQCDLSFEFVNTGTNMTVFFTPPAASSIHDELGDGTIGSFYVDSDGSFICAASVAFNGSQIQLAVMADDSTSPEKDGFSSGESINWFYETTDGNIFAITGSEIIGGKGGGGRKDFAQAGGQFKDKIDEAFEKIKTLI